MPIGTCDPASRGAAYNEFDLEINHVRVWGRFGWDGVSVRPDCDGPLIRIWARNDAGVTKYAWFQGRKGQPKSLEMVPGFNDSWGAAVLANRGFASYQDIEGLIITDSPDVPPDWRIG